MDISASRSEIPKIRESGVWADWVLMVCIQSRDLTLMDYLGLSARGAGDGPDTAS